MSSDQSNATKRHEQITRWHESETDKASNLIKEAERIKFTKEVQFLSACNNNDWEEIGRLLSEGIDINSAQDDGLTSLHQACIDDDEHLVKYLIEHGAYIDVQDKEGWTPLFAAISCNYLPITKYLVSCGARLDMVSFEGELPLDQSNNESIATYIKDEMSKQNLDPEEIRNRERTIMLIDIEAMKVSKDFSNFIFVDNGGSLLHIAACKDYMDVLEKLLDIISPEMLNHTDNDGWNALHVAAHWGNRKACVMLINADIDFDKVTFSNQTVLEVSDDDVKPYIREEIRKARFRRQEKISIKRPAEIPNPEFQPSETKIICQDKKVPSSDDNHQPQQPKSNGDKHVISTENSAMESVIEIHESISSPGGTTDIINIVDVPSKSTVNDPEKRELETSSDQNSTIAEPVSIPTVENSKPIISKDFTNTAANDTKAAKVVVPVMTPSKAVESESQRKDKARHVRSTRRSTQGVTAEEIDEAKKMISFDKNNTGPVLPMIVPLNVDSVDGPLPQSQQQQQVNTEAKDTKAISHESQLKSDKSINGDVLSSNSTNEIKQLPNVSISTAMAVTGADELTESSDKKGKIGGHVVNKRRTRERPPTGLVDPKDVQAALQATDLSKLSDVNNRQNDPEIDYKALYENELKEIEKLQQHVSRLRHDLEESEGTIRNLQNNHVAPKLLSSPQISPGYDIKEIEKLRDDNKKMKEANSALIRVISRLSHQSPKNVTSSN